MDTSETYIKMCEKATEIQDLWLSGGFNGAGQDKCLWFYGNSLVYTGGLPEANHFFIWLPRQDQLQEMLNFSIDDSTLMICDFLYHAEEKGTIISQYETWEQLWLAFAMKEKFNKIWNREDWIKDGV